MENVQCIDTTIGELIVALSDEASKIFPDEKDASKVVALALGHLVYAANLKKNLGILELAACKPTGWALR